ncbi:terpenoid synthase [Cubamyces sp. BRFM 1775]|nr:terpenoid synthase [Cubamyces sp. BRFM 1775]
MNVPDTMARWPWPRRINPYYEDVAPESAECLRSFDAFSPDQQAIFDRCNFGLLAALVYPDADRGHFRVCCDLMNMLFVLDEQTDVSDPAKAQHIVETAIDGVVHPWHSPPPDEPVIGEIVRQFWRRALEFATPQAQARFQDVFSRYVRSLVEQCKVRDEGGARTVDEYMLNRRFDVGTDPCYAIAELRYGLPQEVFDHPLLRDASACATDLVILDNDLASYRKEYAIGDVHNIIPVVMRDKGLNLNEAVEWLAAEHAKVADRFCALWKELATLEFGSAELDDAFGAYVNYLANWPRANVCWSFEGGRYFGTDGARVKLERVVRLERK